MNRCMLLTISLIGLAAAATGCAKSYVVTASHNSPEQAHYVIIQGNTVYDCMSMPDGRSWNPTCVEVAMKATPPDYGERDLAAVTYTIISEDEVKQPPMALSSRGGDEGAADGPKIVLKSPQDGGSYSGGFGIDLRFEPGESGVEVDPGSLEVTYLRGWGIDITDRLGPYRTDSGVYVDFAPFPAGEHSVEVYIEDMDQNPSRAIFTVLVSE